MLAVICVSQTQQAVNQYTDGENASEWCGRSVYRCSPSVDRFNQVEARGKLLCVVRDRHVAAVKYWVPISDFNTHKVILSRNQCQDG